MNLKLLFQGICLKNIGWDDPIGNLETKWGNIVKLLSGYIIILRMLETLFDKIFTCMVFQMLQRRYLQLIFI